MVLSALVSYLATNGGMLIAGKPSAMAHGYGQVAAAGALIVCFVKERNKLFKGMSIFVPNAEVVKTLETEFQEVQNQEKTK
jgi:hypothetical protein